MISYVIMDKSKLRYVICPGSNPSEEFQPLYNSVYDCWYRVWKEAYKEMQLNRDLYSDSFTRQDYVGAIFYGDRCLGLCFFRWANIQSPDFASDSYFSYWTPEDMQALALRGPNIIISSNFTICPLARKGNLDFSMKDLLTGISVEFFMNANADSMAANLRVDKKVNEACAKWGGQLIRADVPISPGRTGDLMVFFKDVVEKRNPLDLQNMVFQLWNDRLVIPKKIAFQENYFVKPRLKVV